MNFKVEWHNSLDSTNAFMRERFIRGESLEHGVLIAAHEQTAGRGRQQRKWLSSSGNNLCFSLFIETHAPLIAIPSLTMAAALAVSEMLNAMRIPAAPKWPNDVLVDGKKICGILSERVERNSSPKAGIIVGIGLNVNMSNEEAAAIDRPATSIRIEDGKTHDLPTILENLFPSLEFWIGEWENGGFPNLRNTWTDKAGPIGKPLSVHDGSHRKTGTLVGFGEHGELLLQTDNGLETIWSGDVS
jgi:BirA family biotin operon repressor/biotin-[acetyl-CoA-carboxylase] ligase